MHTMSNYDPRMICVISVLFTTGMCLLLVGLYLWRHSVVNVLISLAGVFLMGIVAWIFWGSKGLLAPTSILAWALTVVSFDTALAVFTITIQKFFGLGRSGAQSASVSDQ